MRVSGALLTVLLLGSVWPLFGKDSHKGPHATLDQEKAKNTLENLTTVSVAYGPTKTLANLPSSPLVANPMFCAPDGRVITSQLLPPMFREMVIDVINPDDTEKTFYLRPSEVLGFTNVAFHTYAASDSEIAVLGEATRGTQMGLIDGPREYFFIFDKEGTFRKSVPLDLPFQPSRFAILPSGKFVMNGLERNNTRPELAIVNEDGSLARYLEISLDTPEEIQRAYQSEFGGLAAEPGDRGMGDFLAFQQFISYHGHLLLVSGKSSMPVFEVGDSGIMNTTKLHLPPNMRLDSFIQSDGNWLVRLKKPALAENTKDEYFIFEVDPETNEFVRRIDTGASHLGTACVSGKKFTNLSISYINKLPYLAIEQGSY